MIASQSQNNYGLKLAFALIILLLVLATTSFYLIQNFYSKAVVQYTLDGKKIYFLESEVLKKIYKEKNIDYDMYQKRLDNFKTLCLEQGYTASNINSHDLHTLKDKEILVVLDVMALSDSEVEDIDNFVIHGGHIIFNYTSAYLNANAMFRKDNLVQRLTGLRDVKGENILHDNREDNESIGVLSTRLMSPLASDLAEGKALNFTLYDQLPILETPPNLEADAYLTNWTQTKYIQTKKLKKATKETSGLVWHGEKGQGKWVYFSFPSYVFVGPSKNDYAHLFDGMLHYLENDFIIRPYPYKNLKSVIFVSEDSEYKYENLKKFYNLAEKHKFSVTAFCVAKLAQENAALTAKVAKSDYVEIGSHSYSHKKIVGEDSAVYEKEIDGSKILLDKITKQNIIGFRPPREEMDSDMMMMLSDSGYTYVLGDAENTLSPLMKDNLMIIPKHGTDDYSYLINLDWNASKILEQMKYEAGVVSSLNGIYTMSTHTHLMSYGNNIEIMDKFMAYVNQQKNLHPLNGKTLVKNILDSKKIYFDSTVTLKKLIVTFNNESYVKNMNSHYSLFVPSYIRVTSIDSEIIGEDVKLLKVSPTQYTIILKNMKPRSQLVVFLNYEKIN